ncbi:MAG TPA: phosphotransferase [Bacillota bacterium]
MMEQLKAAVNSEYGLTVSAIKPFHGVWRLISAQGVFCLKRMRCDSQQLISIHRQICQIAGSGFRGLLPFLTARDGRPFMIFRQQHFTVSPWLSGTNPDFTNLNQLKKTAELWGRLHSVALPPDLLVLNPAPDPWEELQAKTRFLASLPARIRDHHNPNRIDRSLATWSGHFLTQAELSLKYLKELKYDVWLTGSAARGFCHNDPAPRNIIIHNQNWYLIDFELSRIGVLLNEWALLIGRALQANCWDYELIAPLFESYRGCRNQATEEFKFLPGLLCFPRAFWRLCSQRFEESLQWSERHFQSRLWELIHAEPQRVKLLQHWFRELPQK